MLDGCGCDHTKASEGEPLALAPDSPAVQLMETLRRVFAEQEAQVLAALNVTEGKATPRRKMSRSDVERALDRLRATQDAIAAAIQDTITTMFQVGGAAALTRIGLDAAFDVFNPRVADAIRHYTVRLAGEVNAVSISKLSETMAQGLEAGETIRELSSRVKDTFNNFSAVRAENIARTESARAYVEGEVAGWESSGVVQGKRWLLAPNACEFCEAAAAMFAERTVALREAFFKQGETLVGSKGGVMKLDYSDVTGPPLHPQCRCDLIAVTE